MVGSGALALWRVADPQISPALVLEALIMTRPQLQPIDTWSHAARLAPIVFLKSLTEKVNEIAQENNDLDEMAISSRKVGYLLRKDLGLKTVRSSSGPEHLKGGYTIIWNGPKIRQLAKNLGFGRMMNSLKYLANAQLCFGRSSCRPS